MPRRRLRGGFGRCLAAGGLAALLSGAALPAQSEQLTRPPAEILAPAMALERLDGGRFALDARAGKVTVVNFWALWCAPCKVEMPALAALQRRLAGADVAVVVVNLGDDPARVRRYVEENDLGELTVVLDNGSDVAGAWHVGGLPVTYVVDPEGRIAYVALGARPWADEEIVMLLEELSAAR